MLCDKVWKFVKRHSTVPGVVIIFAATWVFMLAVQSGEPGAVWVQALGSIGAILAATYIAREDRRTELEREKAKVRVICRALELMLGNANHVLMVLNEAFRGVPEAVETGELTRGEDIRKRVELVEQSIRELGSLDLTQLPSIEAVNAVVGTIAVMKGAIFQAQLPDIYELAELHGDDGPLCQHVIAAGKYLRLIHQLHYSVAP